MINALFVVSASTGEAVQITGADRIFYDPIWMSDGLVLAGSIVTGGKIGSVWTAFSGVFGKPKVQITKINPSHKSLPLLLDGGGAPRQPTPSSRGDPIPFSTSGDH